MSTEHPRLAISIEALRREFDEGFASPAGLPDAGLEPFVAIRSAGQPLALRVSDLTRLEARREIVPLPAQNPNLLGIAGIQGRLVPVYCLALLLGFERDAADWRWIAVCGSPDPFGLAFEAFDACFLIPPTNILDLKGERPARRHVQHAVRFQSALRNVVQIRSIQATFRNAASPGSGAIKES
jgi:chemotaxis signal transduction protein